MHTVHHLFTFFANQTDSISIHTHQLYRSGMSLFSVQFERERAKQHTHTHTHLVNLNKAQTILMNVMHLLVCRIRPCLVFAAQFHSFTAIYYYCYYYYNYHYYCRTTYIHVWCTCRGRETEREYCVLLYCNSWHATSISAQVMVLLLSCFDLHLSC